jgi:hypothetical protein
MVDLIKKLKKISSDLASLEEEIEINGHKIKTQFVANFGRMNSCARHKVYVDEKAVGWYEEGPSKSFLKSNWTLWILDSIYFASEYRDKTGKEHEFEVAEMPYSEPPLYCPIFDNPEEFLKWAIHFKLVDKKKKTLRGND